MCARPFGEWSDAKLPAVAQLARLQTDIDHGRGLLDAEDTVILNPRGRHMRNPRALVVDREEVLNAYLFDSISEVREITDDWLGRHNEIRPHDALGSLPPARYRERLLAAEIPL